MGGFGSVLTYIPKNPNTILTNNPSLTTYSSWNSIFITNTIIQDTILSEFYSIVGYPGPTSPYPKPYYIIRPLTGITLSIGITTPILGIVGNSTVSTVSVVEDTQNGQEVIDMFIKTNYMNYEYEGSITNDGILTDSFTFVNSMTLADTPGYFIKETNNNNIVNGENITITYDMMAYNILINRTITGPSTDTIDTVSNIIQSTDFNMGDLTTNLTFKFFIKNTNAVESIIVETGADWIFYTYTILPKHCVCFIVSIDKVNITGTMIKLNDTIACP